MALKSLEEKHPIDHHILQSLIYENDNDDDDDNEWGENDCDGELVWQELKCPQLEREQEKSRSTSRPHLDREMTAKIMIMMKTMVILKIMIMMKVMVIMLMMMQKQISA